jgi:hypothetical protein
MLLGTALNGGEQPSALGGFMTVIDRKYESKKTQDRPVPHVSPPVTGSNHVILELQRTVGNRQVARLLEADAAQWLHTGSSRLLEAATTRVVQRKGPDDNGAADWPRQAGDPREAQVIGSEGERHEFGDAEADLRAQGYGEVHYRTRFKGWLERAFPNKKARPEVVAVDHDRKVVLVEDFTAGPWSRAALKPGDLRKLPNEIPERGAGRLPAEDKPHLDKTIENGRQLARNLPPEFAGYKVVVRDRYWKAGGYSREIIVEPAGPPTPTGAAPPPSAVGSGRAIGAGATGGTPASGGRSASAIEGEVGRGGRRAYTGVPDMAPVVVGGPNARGAAAADAAVLVLQGINFVLGWLNDRRQRERVHAALGALEGEITRLQQRRPDCGVLLVIYFTQIEGHPDSPIQPGPEFARIEMGVGRDPRTADKQRRGTPRLLPGLSPMQREQVSQQLWIPPPQPVEAMPPKPPLPVFGLATFSSRTPTLQDVEWSNLGGFDDEGTTRLTIPEGIEARFFVLQIPAEVASVIPRERDPEIKKQLVPQELRGGIPVVRLDPTMPFFNVAAAALFPADQATADLFGMAPRTTQLGPLLIEDFDLVRWARPEQIIMLGVQ